MQSVWETRRLGDGGRCAMVFATGASLLQESVHANINEPDQAVPSFFQKRKVSKQALCAGCTASGGSHVALIKRWRQSNVC